MIGAVVVYKSTHPDVTMLSAKWEEEMSAFNAAVTKYKAEIGVDSVMMQQGFIGVRVAGLPYRGEPREGWRVQDDALVPDKRTRIGKEAAGRLLDIPLLGFPGRSLPGMPAEYHGQYTERGSFLIHHPHVEVYDDVIYAVWSVDVTAHDSLHHQPLQINEDQWTLVPLSVYYAAVEFDAAIETAAAAPAL